VGQFVFLTASENKANEKVSGLQGFGAESTVLVTWLGQMSTTPSNSRDRAGGPAGSRRLRREAGAGSQPVGNTELLGWLRFLPDCSPALLGLCYPKHVIKCMQLLCQSPAKLLLVRIMGQMNLQILVDSRTSFVPDSCWQLGELVEQWCNVLPLREILLAKGAI